MVDLSERHNANRKRAGSLASIAGFGYEFSGLIEPDLINLTNVSILLFILKLSASTTPEEIITAIKKNQVPSSKSGEPVIY